MFTNYCRTRYDSWLLRKGKENEGDQEGSLSEETGR